MKPPVVAVKLTHRNYHLRRTSEGRSPLEASATGIALVDATIAHRKVFVRPPAPAPALLARFLSVSLAGYGSTSSQ